MKKIIIKNFLIIISIYFPLLFYSFHLYFIENKVIKESLDPKYIAEITSQFNLGYFPQYNPRMVKQFKRTQGYIDWTFIYKTNMRYIWTRVQTDRRIKKPR